MWLEWRLRRDIRKVVVRTNHPDTWWFIWYAPHVAVLSTLSSIALVTWVVVRHPDEFWKPVAGALGMGSAAIVSMLLRRLLQKG